VKAALEEAVHRIMASSRYFPVVKIYLVNGWTKNRHIRGTTIAKAMETNTGLMTVMEVKEPADVPRLEMTCVMTSPATSSSMAALERMTPSLLFSRPLVLRMVKVVPREVEQRAAPAAKACTADALSSFSKTKDRAMGVPTPIKATRPER